MCDGGRSLKVGPCSTRRNSRWVNRRRERRPYLVAVMLRRAKTHECCRYETRPTRASREETVERVTKPCGRNEASGGSRRGMWTSSCLACAEG